MNTNSHQLQGHSQLTWQQALVPGLLMFSASGLKRMSVGHANLTPGLLMGCRLAQVAGLQQACVLGFGVSSWLSSYSDRAGHVKRSPGLLMGLTSPQEAGCRAGKSTQTTGCSFDQRWVVQTAHCCTCLAERSDKPAHGMLMGDQHKKGGVPGPTLQQIASLAGQASLMPGLYSEPLPQGNGVLGADTGK